MALVCASCQTDNRDGAKFCKGCGGRLMSADAVSSRKDAWPITQPLPLPSGPGPRAVQDETTVIVGALDRSSRPSQTSIPPASRDAAPRAPRASRPPSAPSSQPARISGKSRSRRRFGSMGVLVALMVAGGAWYVYSARTVEPPMVARVRAPSLPVTPAVDVPQAVAPPATPVVAPAPPVPVPVPAPGPAPAVAPPAQRAAATPPPAAPPLIMQQAPSTAAAAATAKPRKQQLPPVTPVAPASVAAPAPVVMAAAPAPSPAPSSDPVMPSSPDAACASQGFFGRSRCMVAQCARAEYRAHPECATVRRQQEIDEEKRNPTLAN